MVTGKAWPNDLKASHFVKMEDQNGFQLLGDVVDGYVTGSSGDNEVVRALDHTTGRKWQHSWGGKMRVPFCCKKR